MKFSVANWHERSIDFCLSRKAFTTMASPPKWAKDHDRNEVLFTPPARIVFNDVSDEEYVSVYRATMQRNLPKIKQWIMQHQDDHVMLLCACKKEESCHRFLLAKLLVWLGCEQVKIESKIGET